MKILQNFSSSMNSVPSCAFTHAIINICNTVVDYMTRWPGIEKPKKADLDHMQSKSYPKYTAHSERIRTTESAEVRLTLNFSFVHIYDSMAD